MWAAPKLLMSGGHSRAEYDEVNAMKNYAMDAGVPSADVFMDHAGFSTYESMYRARDVFCAKRVLIVSQGCHLCRAVYDAREILAWVKDYFYCRLQVEPQFLGEPIPISGDGNLSNG